jgi:hypothetical protein
MSGPSDDPVSLDDVSHRDVPDSSLGHVVSHPVSSDDSVERDVLHDSLGMMVVMVNSRERRTVSSSGNNLEVLVGEFSGNADVSLGLDNDSNLVSVVDDNMLVSVMVMVDNGSVVGDTVKSELSSVLSPVSLSGLGDTSSSGVESGVVAEVGSSFGHPLLVFLQVGSLKYGERSSILFKFDQNFLLEGSTECT